MKLHRSLPTVLAALAVLGFGSLAIAQDVEDPYAWLEDVTGDKAMEWVKAQNTRSNAAIQVGDYAALQERLLSILNSDARIPYVEKIGDSYYNFWQDAQHVRGVWRRTDLASYRSENPQWETVIDLDALSAQDGTLYTWHGASCLPPELDRCIVSLSPGGSDADIKREFDLSDKSWVKDGFQLPLAKSEVSWIDIDHLYLMTDTGPGSLTTSGYPRQARVWTRGTAHTEAPVVFEGLETDVSVGAWRDHTKGFERDFVYRSPSFFTSEMFQRRGDQLVKIDVPADAGAFAWREWLVVQLRSDWTVGGTTWPSGSLITVDYEKFIAGDRNFSAIFTPTEHIALEAVTATKGALVLTTLEDVRSRVSVARPGAQGWTSAAIPGLPEFATVNVSAVDSDESDDLWLVITDFLTPTTLSLASAAEGGAIEKIKSLPTLFNADGLVITQHFATSKDGTKVPYFQVSKKKLKKKGKNPTLLYGYGGFEVSMKPSYNATIGASWLEKGGTYVLANIRGGGEYGPQWHQAALKEKRHKAYEDFAAVAQDLAARKVADAEHLGAMGGSNGGLLMGNMLTQYPQLFGAIVCQVPLLDMKRYTHLLAGASWMEEYGDPDDPAQWSFIQTFSPYHLYDAAKEYPPVLFVTSTRDDRVHPGHARKLAAKMIDGGEEVYYWEDTEGGHGAASTNEQRARLWATTWTYLWQQIAD